MKLTQTNPLIVTHKGFTGIQSQSSPPVGPALSIGKNKTPNQADRFVRSTGFNELDIQEAVRKQASKTITKSEYSGGFRVPQESLTKPYMKNKGRSAAEAAASATQAERAKTEFNEKPYSKDEIFSRLGLSNQSGVGAAAPTASAKSVYNTAAPSLNTTGIQKQQTAHEIQQMSSQDLVSQAEQKLKDIRERKENLQKKREADELRERNRKEKLILQSQETLEEVFVTLDEHKIKMIKSFLHQIELKEKLKDLQLKSKSLGGRASDQERNQKEKQVSEELSNEQMMDDLRVIAFLKGNSVFKIEKEKIKRIWSAYQTMLKKDFDLHEFLSPNDDRTKKENNVTGTAVNPFRVMSSSAKAYVMLIEQVIEVIVEEESKSKVFSSHDTKKEKEISEIRVFTIRVKLNALKEVAEVLGYTRKDVIAQFGSDDDENVTLSELREKLLKLSEPTRLAAEKEVLVTVQKFEAQEKALKDEFSKQSRVKELEFEIEQAREMIRQSGQDPLDDATIREIIRRQEQSEAMGGMSDQESMNLQSKPIMLFKEKLLLQKELVVKRTTRSKSATEAAAVKFTIPDPYAFDERDKAKLRDRDDSSEEDEEDERFVFHPKKVPDHVKNVHLFEQLMAAEEKRREEIRRKSMQLTKQNEKPFSFYNRASSSKRIKHIQNKDGEDERPYWETDPVMFKAKEVPVHVTEKLLDKMNKNALNRRKARVEARMNQLKRISSLPPRMAEHAENERIKRALKQRNDDESGGGGTARSGAAGADQSNPFFQYSFEPPKAKKVPNFKKLHQTMQEQLDAQKKGFKPTEMEPFHFNEAKRAPAMDYMDYENMQVRATMDQAEVHRKMQKIGSPREPEFLPLSTKKASGIQNYRKQQEELKAKKLKAEEDVQKQKAAKVQKLKERFYSSKALVDDHAGREQREAEMQQSRAKERRENQEAINNIYSRIQANLDEKPLLIEKYDKDMAPLERAVQKWTYRTPQGGTLSQQTSSKMI